MCIYFYFNYFRLICFSWSGGHAALATSMQLQGALFFVTQSTDVYLFVVFVRPCVFVVLCRCCFPSLPCMFIYICCSECYSILMIFFVFFVVVVVVVLGFC